jgi:hypothetical protein
MTYFPDTRLQVKPVVFHPHGVPHDEKWAGTWLTMMVTARKKYLQMLKGHDTFALDPKVLEVNGIHSIEEYLALTHREGEPAPAGSTNHIKSNGILSIAAEVIHHPFFTAHSRYDLPYVLPILVVDPNGQWSSTGGHNLNGGVNRGAGIAVISSQFNGQQKLLSTLLHELGHALGLPHVWERVWIKGYAMDVDVYEWYYDRWRSPSIMSYNVQNHTNTVGVKKIPGSLIADDIETLSLNRLAFPELVFDPQSDYQHPDVETATNGIAHDRTLRKMADSPWDMTIMQPTSLVWFYSEAGSAEGTHPQQLNDNTRRCIATNSGGAPWAEIKPHTWLSKKAAADIWVTLEMTFPIPVTLDRVIVYTGHGGGNHRAKDIQIKFKQENGAFKTISTAVAAPADATILFKPATARVWQLRLHTGSSGQVAMRGVRTFHGDREWFPPEGPIARTSSGEAFGSKVQNVVAIQRTIRPSLPAVGWDPATMWHSDKVNDIGWVSLEVAFPEPLQLDKLIVFSGHSGKLHQAKQMQVQVMQGDGSYKLVHQQQVKIDVQIVNFTPQVAQVWKLAFQGAPNGFVVLRSLRFFDGQREWYPGITL